MGNLDFRKETHLIDFLMGKSLLFESTELVVAGEK